MILSIIVLAVILGATADGFNDRGMKTLGHILEALEKVALLLGGLLSGTWIVIISYIAFRVSLFDILRNLAKGDPIFYIGTASLWDRFVGKIPPHGLTFIRVIFLAFAISYTIIEL